MIFERCFECIALMKKEINLCFKDNISISIFQCHLSTPKKRVAKVVVNKKTSTSRNKKTTKKDNKFSKEKMFGEKITYFK